ncbi:MAG TPA: MBL fold metallo-hydrolase [Actinomycetota bacterium]|nr:MBL fold metallo-hydrolase [Actinomycetota bacterium]
MRIHVIPTGTLVGNKTFLRGEGWPSLLRPYEPFEFPAFSYVLEHDDGHIAIDTGMTSRARTPRLLRRMVPRPIMQPEDEVGPQMRARGLNPEDVRLVIVTHLDWDHFGGVGHFPNADVLVHRPEHNFASTLMGKLRYQPKLWPTGFSPALYDLNPEPFGPFPTSKVLTENGAVRLVPIPGHSIAQVAAIVRTGDVSLFFGADHMLRQDWFVDDYNRGRLKQLGLFYPDAAIETSRRIHMFLESQPTVLLPAHDADAVGRLLSLETVKTR